MTATIETWPHLNTPRLWGFRVSQTTPTLSILTQPDQSPPENLLSHIHSLIQMDAIKQPGRAGHSLYVERAQSSNENVPQD